MVKNAFCPCFFFHGLGGRLVDLVSLGNFVGLMCGGEFIGSVAFGTREKGERRKREGC